ncbi:PREDICTED: uncharacterized protein LOC108970441 isoform X2 [Bactrocera latifrons]|nr:PREDICTED: uncharacterized protein LOC108970441 isoform X2 [Bactrocera latifrons]
MPRTLQRLATIVQSILTIIECPVCLDSITPPVMQCQNGHLLCLDCRIRAERCPVCRDRYTPQRALIAEQIYTAITSAYNLCSGNEDKLRQKLFGPGAQCAEKVLTRRWRRAEAAKQTIDDCDAQTEVRTASIYAKRSWLKATLGSGAASCAGKHVAAGGGQLGHFSLTNETDTAAKVDAPLADTAVATEMCATKRASKRKKILMKLWHARATSTENLSTSVAATSGQLNGKVIGMNSIDNGLATSAGATTPATVTHVHVEPSSAHPHQPSPTPSISHRSVRNASSEVETVMKNSQNHSTLSDNNGGAGAAGICEAVADTAAETKTRALLMRTQQQPETRLAMTMPLNCATTRKIILNATTTTSESVQVNAVSKLVTATPPPTATPNTNDSTSECENKQPVANGEEAEKEEFEAVKEWINGKISPQQQHVQPHSQLSTWQLQRNQRQRQQLSPTTSSTDRQSTAAPPANVIAIAVERCPSMLRSQSPSQSIFNDYKNNKQHEICNCPSSTLLYVDRRRPASHTLTSSTEYLNKIRQPAAATDAMLRTSAIRRQCSGDSLASSRKNSNNSIGSSCSSGSRSDITASAHSILTPASSLSSGVFSTSVDANDLAASIEACRALPDDATEITAIRAHKNALLSPVDSLGQSSSITSSLRSLSSLASSLFSSPPSEDALPPLMAAASAEACLSAAALNSTFSSSVQPAVTPPVTHLSSVAPTLIRKQLGETASSGFRCPCDGCDQKFNASSQLQRHVKVEHRLPILSFAGDELVAVPLRQPLADVVLILEAGGKESANNSSNNNNDNYNNNNIIKTNNNNSMHCNEDNALSDAWRGVDQKDNADCVDEPNAKDNKDVKDMHKAEQDIGGSSGDVHSRHIEKQLEQTRECWIRIKAQEASIDTTALLQATAAESADYVLKMRLSCIGDTTVTAEGPTAAIELQLVRRSPSAVPVKAQRSEGNIVAALKATTTEHS